MSGKDDSTPEDDDRTQIASLPDKKTPPAPEAADEDVTQFVEMPDQPPESAEPPADSGDDERTRFAQTVPPDKPDQSVSDDTTQFVEASIREVAPNEVSQVPVGAASTAAEGLTAVPQPRPGAETTGGLTTEVGVGTLINNNYEITQVLKSGGMGEVYRGVEIGTGDPVAIKAILPELAEDEKAGLLFKREARTLRQLADEAIVRYYNYVHDRDLDRYFLVMEFIEGVPLSDYIESRGAIPSPAATTLLKRLAKGLSKAHGQDVIHRDLSPDNVMLPEGDVSEARLIDFGIAKSNVVTEGTMHGQFAGKFKYVAPEQLGHWDGVIGPATDIYGLGLLVCAASLGKPLDMGSSIVEAVQSRQSIPDLSEVPDELRPILAHMLEPDPLRRPASMEEVRRMLENPGMIPPQYREGVPMPPPVEMTGRSNLVSMPPMTNPPPGLQVPTASNFGHTTQTTQVPLAATEPERESGGGVLSLLALVFVAVLGAAGWYAWQSGMIGEEAVEEQVTEAEPSEGIPAPQTTTRAGFLAAFDTGACTYATRVSAGSNAGMVEGYSSTGDTFAGLPVAYEEQFGARPAILPRQVSTEQCSVLDFARALQGRGRAPMALQMSGDEVVSGDGIGAQIRATGEEAIWAVLVAPNGGTYSLTKQLSEPVGGQRSLNFSLRLTQGQEPAPHLILVVSSDRPLTIAATAPEGAAVGELLPLVLDEISKRGGAASASVGYVLLKPAP